MKQLLGRWKKYRGQICGMAVLTAIALILISGVSVTNSLAYFTTYVTAKGGYTISAGDSTKIHEEFKDWKKIIQVENTGSVDCYVRVKIFAGQEFTITSSGDGWIQASDGYWYFDKEISPGGLTDKLTASIHYPAELEADFDVVVVQECTPVTYDEKGKAIGAVNADWSRAAVNGEEAVD